MIGPRTQKTILENYFQLLEIWRNHNERIKILPFFDGTAKIASVAAASGKRDHTRLTLEAYNAEYISLM